MDDHLRTPAPRAKARRVLAVLCCLVMLGLSGCSGSDEMGAERQASAPDLGMAEGGSDAKQADGAYSALSSGSTEGSADQLPADRAIISTGDVQLQTKPEKGSTGVTQTRAEVQQLVDRVQGTITNEETQTEPQTDNPTKGTPEVSYAYLTLRVPSAKFDEVLSELSQLPSATLISRRRSAEDVTTQKIDVDARVAAQEASLKRLRVLFDKAQNLRDIATIEGELTKRQAELDSLKSQQAWLTDQTSMSTITVTIQREGPQPTEESTGFLGGLKAGWAALVASAAQMAVVVGAVLPWLIVVLPLGALIAWLVRRRPGRRTPGSAAPTTSTPMGEERD